MTSLGRSQNRGASILEGSLGLILILFRTNHSYLSLEPSTEILFLQPIETRDVVG